MFCGFYIFIFFGGFLVFQPGVLISRRKGRGKTGDVLALLVFLLLQLHPVRARLGFPGQNPCTNGLI
jgi:hypothetical protein